MILLCSLPTEITGLITTDDYIYASCEDGSVWRIDEDGQEKMILAVGSDEIH